MVRLLRLTTHALIALAAIEGSVAHLAHNHHCHHGGEQVSGSGDCSHVHASTAADEPTFAAVSAVVLAEENCLACAYLAQRAGLGPVTGQFESCAAVDLTRPMWSRVDQSGASGGHSARAPPVLG